MGEVIVCIYYCVLFLPSHTTSILHLRVWDSIALGYLVPIFDVCSKLKDNLDNATQMSQPTSPSR
jgi:hypothetical protein